MASAAVMSPPTSSSRASTASTPETPSAPSPTPLAGPPAAIIFDWDDTLLASSWLAQNGLKLDEPAQIPPQAQVELEALQSSVVSLLTKALSLGNVCIITNAEAGWVELSAKRFMPAVVPVLDSVRVVSARSTFEPSFPSPADWKVQAFAQELGAHFDGVAPEDPKHVISFGDSVHERQAVHSVTAGLREARAKSIKFVERPSAEQLKREVDLVSSCLGDIINHPGNLDLMLTIQLLYN